jgi:hypothetical protein
VLQLLSQLPPAVTADAHTTTAATAIDCYCDRLVQSVNAVLAMALVLKCSIDRLALAWCRSYKALAQTVTERYSTVTFVTVTLKLKLVIVGTS